MRLSRRNILASGAAALAGGALTSILMTRYYDGPVSDHWDGKHFRDPQGAAPKSFGDLMKWRFGGGDAPPNVPWPARAQSAFSDRPPARVDGAGLRISYVGHASFLVQTGGLNILLDPVWSERASPFSFAGPKRVNDPGIPFEALPKIDVALVSHAHYDHLDVATLSRLAAAHRLKVVTPLGNDAVMRRHDTAIDAQAIDWHERVALSDQVAATLVPLRHWSARGLFDRNDTLWGGFVIETPAGHIYVVSDSGYGDGFRFREARERYGPFRLAILPIGAYEPRWFMRDQHMNPAEAVQALQDCGAEQALAHHWGTFKLTDEAIDAPVQALEAARNAAGLPADRFRVLRPGEAWEM